MSELKINRVWQMPNKNTFDIKPIKELILKYKDKLPKDAVIADPFANKNKIANITNDLDPQYDTTHHMDATDFLKSLDDNSLDMLLYDPPYCYDKKTMILTKTGWKNISDVNETDEIATRASNGEIEYQHPTSIIQKNYAGKMIKIKNDKIDLLVTPNHNCLIKNGDEFGLIEAGMLNQVTDPIIFTSHIKWKSIPLLETEIPSVHSKSLNKTFDTKYWYTVELMRFLGIFLRYGETRIIAKKRKNTQKYTINYKTILTYKNISEREEKLIDRTIMRTMPVFHGDIKYRKTKTGYIFSGKQLYVFLSQFKNKDNRVIPQFIKEYSAQDFRKMFEFLFRSERTFETKSKTFAYDLQEVIMKAGGNAIVSKKEDIYVVTPSTTHYNENIVNREDVQEIDFEGQIYCVSVPNMVIMVQREGIPCWCGNSPRQVSECYKNLGQTVNMETTQASYWSKQKAEIGRLVKQGGYVVTCSWNSGGIGKKYGFEIVEILLVAHGGWHNDTIVVVERKV